MRNEFVRLFARLLREVNRNELIARVEPCGTCKWKIESGKLKVIFHEVFLFVLTPKASAFVFGVGFFICEGFANKMRNEK